MKQGSLYIWHKTNVEGTRLVAAVHWRWSITWRWLLSYSRPSKIQLWHGWHGNSHTGHFVYTLYTPFGNLRFEKQENMRKKTNYERLPLAE